MTRGARWTSRRQLRGNDDPQGVGNSLWAYATSGRLPAEATLRALEAAIVRVEPELSIRDQAVAWWSFAQLGSVPSDRCARSLEQATRRLARSMNARDVCNVAWALSTLSPGLVPSVETLRALAQAERRLAPAMTPSDVAGVMMGYALNDVRREGLLARSGDDTWRALEAAAVRCAPAMDAAHLGGVMYCYAACGRRARVQTRGRCWSAPSSPSRHPRTPRTSLTSCAPTPGSVWFPEGTRLTLSTRRRRGRRDR